MPALAPFVLTMPSDRASQEDVEDALAPYANVRPAPQSFDIDLTQIKLIVDIIGGGIDMVGGIGGVVALERGDQALLHIGRERLSPHGSLDHHGSGHFVVTQGGHEGDRLPFSKGDTADQPDTPRSPPPEPHEIGADRSLIDKHQSGGIKHALLAYPAPARAGHVCSIPFRRLQAFF